MAACGEIKGGIYPDPITVIRRGEESRGKSRCLILALPASALRRNETLVTDDGG